MKYLILYHNGESWSSTEAGIGVMGYTPGTPNETDPIARAKELFEYVVQAKNPQAEFIALLTPGQLLTFQERLKHPDHDYEGGGPV